MDLASPLQTNRPAKCGPHFVPYISLFEAFYSVGTENWKSLYFLLKQFFFLQTYCTFFINTVILLTLFQIFLFISLHGRITKETCHLSLK